MPGRDSSPEPQSPEPQTPELQSKATHMIPQDVALAEVNRITAKYGGMEKLVAKHGKELPPAIMAEIEKGLAPIALKHSEGQMHQLIREQRERHVREGPLVQERVRGMTFYIRLKPKNDPHYIGGGVKLGTPDCPILWYKPTDAEKYRVIYADLSVKDMAPDDVKKLPEAKPK